MQKIIVLVFILLTVSQLFSPKTVLADCISDCVAEGNSAGECSVMCGTAPGIPTPGEGDVDIDIDSIQDGALPDFNFGSTSTLGDIIDGMLPILFGIVGTALLLYLIAGGFGYLTSGGDPKKMEGAKTVITNAVIGFVLVISAFFITQAVSYIFNLGGAF